VNHVHHVNLSVPRGRAAPIAAFYRDVLGFRDVERPENGREGVWLDIGDGTQLHLSERDGSPHPQQHFALVVDDLSAVRARLHAVGADYETAEDIFLTGGRGFTRDPAGNRIELIASRS
jgi:catechol 2,3-dioxygenase-like lactoylglutathione lyase family enzyme